MVILQPSSNYEVPLTWILGHDKTIVCGRIKIRSYKNFMSVRSITLCCGICFATWFRARLNCVATNVVLLILHKIWAHENVQLQEIGFGESKTKIDVFFMLIIFYRNVTTH